MATSFVPPGGPLELLFEAPELPSCDLGTALSTAYGGGKLGFAEPALIANFVSSLDGVVGLPSTSESGGIISQNSSADRFVMGLLRALADVVVVGASTFRRTPRHRWHADAVCPSAAQAYAELRARLGLAVKPLFVLVTASGDFETNSPALEHALIATTREGESRLRGRVPAGCRLVAFEQARVDVREVVALLRGEGARLILTEGGPALFGEIVARGLLDDLFLTASPNLFGRYASDRRKALTEGVDLAGLPLQLSSVRRHGSHLFLRYSRSK
ncbi:MAG: dihydrofolate reductase family protein [Myxococcota bacterium]